MPNVGAAIREPQTAEKKTGTESLFGFVIAPKGRVYCIDDGENTPRLLHRRYADSWKVGALSASV